MAGNILYIGQTGWLGRRLRQHRWAKRIPFVRWIVWRCGEQAKDRLEARLIAMHSPPYNKYLVALTQRREAP
jgi:excinuclease UvrABC nuclease subunit